MCSPKRNQNLDLRSPSLTDRAPSRGALHNLNIKQQTRLRSALFHVSPHQRQARCRCLHLISGKTCSLTRFQRPSTPLSLSCQRAQFSTCFGDLFVGAWLQRVSGRMLLSHANSPDEEMPSLFSVRFMLCHSLKGWAESVFLLDDAPCHHTEAG